MPRHRDSFARALKDAEKRLQEALNQRSTFIAHLAALEEEIPRLGNIIASLSGKEVMPNEAFAQRTLAPTGEHRAETSAVPPSNMTPEELAKWYTERDLSNVGSVVPERPAAEPVDEDELLPDDFATGKR